MVIELLCIQIKLYVFEYSYFNYLISIMNKKNILRLKYLGLSVAIFGSLFKIMSWTGATVLLIIGLSFVGIHFLIKVFEK
mgnify:CR=1 FL=1